jgi:hypothetical protein
MVGGVIRSPAANKIDKKEVISDEQFFGKWGESEFKISSLLIDPFPLSY